MYTKAKMFNLALGALLLTKQIANTDNDPSMENRVLNLHWDSALGSALSDMDLDSTSSQANLELVSVRPNNLWGYAYKYPTDCAYFRRIQSCIVKDYRDSKIAMRIGVFANLKVIFTNVETAIGEYISKDLPLSTLSDSAAMVIAHRLAILSAPLIVGKGSTTIKKELENRYTLLRLEAQEADRMENLSYESDEAQSEFVRVRLS